MVRHIKEASMNVITHASIRHTTSTAVLRMQEVLGDTRNMDAIVEEALQAWLHKAACANPPAAQAAARGYLWKSLFLPEGTLLRFDYKKQSYHAEVRGDAIVYQGRAYSPRQLLLHVTGSVRNAWRELWLRCPGDHRWHLADTRRHILRRTPRGLHKRGIDRGRPVFLEDRWLSRDTEANLRATLYRDDAVRDDQPDLSCRTHGAGRSQAGRSGKRDRRYTGDVFGRPVPRSVVVEPYTGMSPCLLDDYNKPIRQAGPGAPDCLPSIPF
jgi:hypothetical protein